MAVLDLPSVLQQNQDKGKISCCIFLDLSKAFDTVNHNILLQKLNRYGTRGEMHNLLKDYLTDRKQFTTYKNAKSNDTKIVCGIPQESTVGPLLFSIYINDLLLVTNSHMKLFADDTAIILEVTNVIQLQDKVSKVLTAIDDWMKHYRLSLKYSKTTYFVIEKTI